MSFLGSALRILKPNHTFKVVNGTQLIWEDERPQPSEEEIQTKIAELEAAEPIRLLRIERDRLLQQTDWRMVEDYPMSNKLNWKTYRQALRDLPNTAEPQLDVNGNLTNITWPEVPA